MRAQIPSTARLLRGAFILAAVRPQPHSIKILFGAAEPPSPCLNSIAQILPSAKAEDEPPLLCLNSAAPTDRRPAAGSVTSSVAGPIGSKPAAKPKQLARANDLAKPTRTAADKPVVKPRDRRSRRTAEAPYRSSVWFQNRLVRQMSRPINNPSRKSPTDCNPSGLIRK